MEYGACDRSEGWDSYDSREEREGHKDAMINFADILMATLLIFGIYNLIQRRRNEKKWQKEFERRIGWPEGKDTKTQ